MVRNEPTTMRHSNASPELNRLTGRILSAAFAVHSALGPGSMERIYQLALAREITKRGMRVAIEVPVDVRYCGESLGIGLRSDLLVEDTVIIEVKAVQDLHAVHVAQMISYLRHAEKPVGFLINFNEPRLKGGIHRIVAPALLKAGSATDSTDAPVSPVDPVFLAGLGEF